MTSQEQTAALDRSTRSLDRITRTLESVRAERDEALRLSAALRDSLRIATERLCAEHCMRAPGMDTRHTDACKSRGRILAGEIGGGA